MKVYLTENIWYDIVYADPPWPKKKGGLRDSFVLRITHL